MSELSDSERILNCRLMTSNRVPEIRVHNEHLTRIANNYNAAVKALELYAEHKNLSVNVAKTALEQINSSPALKAFPAQDPSGE